MKEKESGEVNSSAFEKGIELGVEWEPTQFTAHLIDRVQVYKVNLLLVRYGVESLSLFH